MIWTELEIVYHYYPAVSTAPTIRRGIHIDSSIVRAVKVWIERLYHSSGISPQQQVISYIIALKFRSSNHWI
jgi:hypothetical protein